MPVALALVAAGCGTVERDRDDEGRVQTRTLIGLYVGDGSGGQASRLCIVPRPDQPLQFAIVRTAPNRTACSGLGTVSRTGDSIRLEMTGDEPCTLVARDEGGQLRIEGGTGAGCAYYCSPGTEFDEEVLEKVGGSITDALRAQDLVGERLCGGA